MTQILCLAVSRKHSHFCVAGVDLRDKIWIRPVSNRHDGAIPESLMAFPDGKKPCLLDILDITLAGKQTSGDFQPENYHLQDRPWRKVGRAKVESLSGYTALSRNVLHNREDRISPNELMALPKARRSSLQLIECSDVVFRPDPRNSSAWRAAFTYFGHKYDLRVTDPVAETALTEGKNIPSQCFLTVSLTEPWRRSSDMEPFCYKLVAGVMPQDKASIEASGETYISPSTVAEFLSAILMDGPSCCPR